MHQIQNAPNSQAMLQNMLMNNPNTAVIAQMLKGGNFNSLQAIAQFLARQKGVNLDDLIRELQS